MRININNLDKLISYIHLSAKANKLIKGYNNLMNTKDKGVIEILILEKPTENSIKKFQKYFPMQKIYINQSNLEWISDNFKSKYLGFKKNLLNEQITSLLKEIEWKN